MSRISRKATVHVDDPTSAAACRERLARDGIDVTVLDVPPRVALVIPVGSRKRTLQAAGIPVDAQRICPSCGDRSHSPTATRCPACDTPVPYVLPPHHGPMTQDRSHYAILVGLFLPIILILILVWTS